MEDGRYSAVTGSEGAGVEHGPGNLNAFRVRAAARVRIAVKCGVAFDSATIWVASGLFQEDKSLDEVYDAYRVEID